MPALVFRSRLHLGFLTCGLMFTSCTPAPVSQTALGRQPHASAPPSATAQQRGDAQSIDTSFRAAFSNQGVAWVARGRACVARAPSFVAVCPKLPLVADVAWNGLDVWAGLPSLGIIVTLDRAAQSVQVGRVAVLSASRVYREDGTAVSYTGAPMRGVLGQPTAAITDGNGNDYVLLAGGLQRVADGVVLQVQAGPFLKLNQSAFAVSAESSEFPSVTTNYGEYRLAYGRLERLDQAGRVLAGVPHEPGRLGVVGLQVVTVTASGQIRGFGLDLQPLR